ncbi:MAG: orotate phosphoribosyltransferase [Gemmatimonadaceae bacterium]
MTDHERLVLLLATRSARRGSFILSSGKHSTLYVDARLVTMSPDGLPLIGVLGLTALRNTGWTIDAIGGLTLGADPIAYAISYASASSPVPIRAFTVRKLTKAHGTGRRIEGPFQAGDHVAIIEDVITTGHSALTAAEAVQDAGGHIRGVLALVDREEGGREALTAAGFPVVSLVTATEIAREIL